jgi:plastocyanin
MIESVARFYSFHPVDTSMRVSIAVAALLFTISCGSSDSPTTPPAGSNKSYDVVTVSNAFSPNILQIAPGDTIRFTIVPAPNGEGHDVTFDAKAGAPENIKVTLNGVFNRVFSTRGSFHYNCFVHPGMSGDVVVQ